MLANRLGILAGLSLCILPAMAQVSQESTTPLTSAAGPLLEHRPMKFHRVRVDATVESENWSGYAVTGTGFTKALGSWTVSTVNCRTTPIYLCRILGGNRRIFLRYRGADWDDRNL